MTERRVGGLRLGLLSDRALGKRVVAGDRGAFAELFRRYRQPLYGYCVSILGNQEDSADALQNTMTKALKALPGDERELQLKPWLYRVARNECIDLIRSRKPAGEISKEEPESRQGVEAAFAGRERLRELLSDLDHLPEKQRSALVMRELNGLSFAEIAGAFETSPSAAKQVVYDARVSLLDLAEGRKMDCEPVREAISERDGRVLRGRRVRAHLRSCAACRDFRAGIDARSRDFKALIPAVPAAAVASVIEMINGPGGGGAALVGLAGAKAALGGSAMKGAAIVAVTASVGAGTVGVIEKNRHKDNANETSNPAVKLSDRSSTSRPVGAAIVSGLSARLSRETEPAKKSNRDAKAEKEGPAAEHQNSGKSDSAPGHDGNSAGSSGSSGNSSDGSPGNSASNGGGSGGSKGLGAIPTHGGKPAQLPEAAAQGQQRAAEAESQGGPPASPGNSASAPGAANSRKPAKSEK